MLSSYFGAFTFISLTACLGCGRICGIVVCVWLLWFGVSYSGFILGLGFLGFKDCKTCSHWECGNPLAWFSSYVLCENMSVLVHLHCTHYFNTLSFICFASN